MNSLSSLGFFVGVVYRWMGWRVCVCGCVKCARMGLGVCGCVKCVSYRLHSCYSLIIKFIHRLFRSYSSGDHGSSFTVIAVLIFVFPISLQMYRHCKLWKICFSNTHLVWRV